MTLCWNLQIPYLLFIHVLVEKRWDKEAGGCDSWNKPPFWIQIWTGPESIHYGLEHCCMPSLKGFTDPKIRWMPPSCILAELGWDSQTHLGTDRNGTGLPRLDRSLNPKEATQKANVYICKNTSAQLTLEAWRNILHTVVSRGNADKYFISPR